MVMLTVCIEHVSLDVAALYLLLDRPAAGYRTLTALLLHSSLVSACTQLLEWGMLLKVYILLSVNHVIMPSFSALLSKDIIRTSAQM